MIHNSVINMVKVRENIIDAINSKLLNIGQTSGRAEMHSGGFNSLMESLNHVDRLIADMAPKVEEPKAKKTQ